MWIEPKHQQTWHQTNPTTIKRKEEKGKCSPYCANLFSFCDPCISTTLPSSLSHGNSGRSGCWTVRKWVRIISICFFLYDIPFILLGPLQSRTINFWYVASYPSHGFFQIWYSMIPQIISNSDTWFGNSSTISLPSGLKLYPDSDVWTWHTSCSATSMFSWNSGKCRAVESKIKTSKGPNFTILWFVRMEASLT